MVQGTVRINGEAYSFDGGEGYWEGDRKASAGPGKGSDAEDYPGKRGLQGQVPVSERWPDASGL